MNRGRFLMLALALAAAPAGAWWPKGHSIIAEAAVRAQPAEVPEFFRQGGALVAHLAQDPDVMKNPEAPALRNTEEPEHFLDSELLKGRPLPPTRYRFLQLCQELKVDPNKVGTVPYSVTEGIERLAVAFAEHRRWPANPHIRTKCLVYAGIVAHYAGDLCMPLHTTVDYDGRTGPDGASPRSGIHAKVDSLIEKVGLKPAELAAGQQLREEPAILPAVVREIEASRALVDRTYALEAQLPPANGNAPWTPSPAVLEFTRERGRAAARFLGSLYLTAWRKSAKIGLPTWLEREEVAATPAAPAARKKASARTK
jgi:hypothetical protein